MKPPVRDQIDGRGVLREPERVVQRREQDGRPDVDALRRLRDRRGHDEQRRHVPVVHEVMLGDPDGVEAVPLGGDTALDGVAVDVGVGTRIVGRVLARDESVAESHKGRDLARLEDDQRDVPGRLRLVSRVALVFRGDLRPELALLLRRRDARPHRFALPTDRDLDVRVRLEVVEPAGAAGRRRATRRGRTRHRSARAT